MDDPIIDYIDATALFETARGQLAVGEMVHTESFSLFEAMSAVEVGNPKMDAGAVSEEPPLPLSERPLTLELSPEQLLSIMDHLLALEASWHSGSPLAQTVYSSLYMMQLPRWGDCWRGDASRAAAPARRLRRHHTRMSPPALHAHWRECFIWIHPQAGGQCAAACILPGSASHMRASAPHHHAGLRVGGACAGLASGLQASPATASCACAVLRTESTCHDSYSLATAPIRTAVPFNHGACPVSSGSHIDPATLPLMRRPAAPHCGR